MKEKIVRYTAEELKKMPSQTDWNRVLNMKDEDIDFSDCPEITDFSDVKHIDFLRPGRPKKQEHLELISLRVNKATVKKLRSYGRGWQTRLRQAIQDLVNKDLL